MSEKLKYQIVMDYIVSQINEGVIKPGEKIPSEFDIVDSLNVSRHTVRKAINELQKTGDIYTEQGKGSFVADKNKNIYNIRSNGNPSKLIGVMVAYLNDTIFPRILNGIESTVSENEYSIFWACTRNDFNKEAECIKNMIDHNVAGIIVEPTQSAQPNPNIYLYNRLEGMGIPVIFIHAHYMNHSEDSNYIMDDDIEAGYKAVKYLIDKGHKDIGGIFKSDDMQGHMRHKGFIKGLEEQGLLRNEDNVVWMSSHAENDMFDEEIVYRQYSEKLKKCTALVCYNDDNALVLARGLDKAGINVPDDVSIVGFDNNVLSDAYKVPFTSLTYPKEKLGQMAAEYLIKMIKDPEIRVQEKLQVDLIEKKSVKEIQ